MHRFIVSKSIWNRMALQLKQRQKKIESFFAYGFNHSNFISREQIQKMKRVKKKPKQNSQSRNIPHLCTAHAKKKPTINVKMKLCYEMNFVWCVRLQRHKVESKSA